MAIEKLNDVFKKDLPSVENFKETGEPIFLVEEGNDEDFPIQITGKGIDRIAKIGS